MPRRNGATECGWPRFARHGSNRAPAHKPDDASRLCADALRDPPCRPKAGDQPHLRGPAAPCYTVASATSAFSIRWAIALALIVFASAVGAANQTLPAQTATAAPAGNADDGKKLFTSYGCYQCHGREAQGSSSTGPRLGPRPIAFTAFSRYVRRPTGQMPPYTTKVVSDADLANIYAFVQTRATPPAVQSVPALTDK